MSFVTINSVAFTYPGLPFCLFLKSLILSVKSRTLPGSILHQIKAPAISVLELKGLPKNRLVLTISAPLQNSKPVVLVLKVLKVNEWVQMGEHL